MKVLYKIDGRFNSLILNKTYDVLSIETTIDNFTYYSIKNEFGSEMYYPMSNFITLEKFREERLKKIGI